MGVNSSRRCICFLSMLMASRLPSVSAITVRDGPVVGYGVEPYRRTRSAVAKAMADKRGRRREYRRQESGVRRRGGTVSRVSQAVSLTTRGEALACCDRGYFLFRK